MTRSHELSNLLVVAPPLEPQYQIILESMFDKVHYRGWGEDASEDELKEADVIFGFLPPNLHSVFQVPRLRLVQQMGAGSDANLKNLIWREAEADKIALASTSGVHVCTISQYFIATTLALYHRLQEQILIAQNEKRSPRLDEFAPPTFVYIEELRGKTVGILGYGAIGRECARLAAAFGANIIAANSEGKKKEQDGYIVPGTGDLDGSIPSAYYSTKDPSSLEEFLSQTDVLLAAVPSTPTTKHLLSSTTLAHLKPSALIVNVGRGDLIDTDALVTALDTHKIAGAALDVTDPEPLPAGHALFGRKNVIVTPHSSALSVRLLGRIFEIFRTNLERFREGKELLNAVSHGSSA